MSVTRRSWRRNTFAGGWNLITPTAENLDLGFLWPPGATSATLLRTRASAEFSVLAQPTGGLPEDGWECGVNAGCIFWMQNTLIVPTPGALNPWFSTFGSNDLLSMTTLNRVTKSFAQNPGAESVSWELPGDMIDTKAQRVLTANSRIMGGISCLDSGGFIGTDDGNAAYRWRFRLNVACLVQWVAPT